MGSRARERRDARRACTAVKYKDVTFLTTQQVLDIHRAGLELFGEGELGVRDRGLLESALAQPGQVLFGHLPNNSLAKMAASYAFYLAKNHPFVNGNKRAALFSAGVFLVRNGQFVRLRKDPWAKHVEALVVDEMTEQEFSDHIAAAMPRGDVVVELD